mgnify:CR=1 FL=1
MLLLTIFLIMTLAFFNVIFVEFLKFALGYRICWSEILSFSMGDMLDLSADDVKRYIRYITDRRLISLGLKGIMKVKKNPLPWVEEMINAPIHGNFFEQRVTDYAKGALTGSWEDVWG